MKDFLKSLLLGEQTRKVLEDCAAGPRPPKVEPAPPPKRMAAPPPRAMTPERGQLIREAIAMRRAKQQILDHLSDEDRAKLVAMAMSALLGQKPGRK